MNFYLHDHVCVRVCVEVDGVCRRVLVGGEIEACACEMGEYQTSGGVCVCCVSCVREGDERSECLHEAKEVEYACLRERNEASV